MLTGIGSPVPGAYTLDGVAAIVLGGVSLLGGRGGMLGPIAAAFILAWCASTSCSWAWTRLQHRHPGRHPHHRGHGRRAGRPAAVPGMSAAPGTFRRSVRRRARSTPGAAGSRSSRSSRCCSCCCAWWSCCSSSSPASWAGHQSGSRRPSESRRHSRCSPPARPWSCSPAASTCPWRPSRRWPHS